MNSRCIDAAMPATARLFISQLENPIPPSKFESTCHVEMIVLCHLKSNSIIIKFVVGSHFHNSLKDGSCSYIWSPHFSFNALSTHGVYISTKFIGYQEDNDIQINKFYKNKKIISFGIDFFDGLFLVKKFFFTVFRMNF